MRSSDMNLKSTFFTRLCAGLFSCNAMEVADLERDSNAFEEKYCFRPGMQPFFTADGLTTVLASMQDNIFYVLEDKLHLAIVFFRFQGKTFLIGPFAVSPFTEASIDKDTADVPLSLSQRRLLYIYCGSFQVTGTEYVTATLQSIFQAADPDTPAFTVQFLKGFFQGIKDYGDLEEEEKDELQRKTIRKNYETENRLLDFIRHGETEKALQEFRHLTRTKGRHKTPVLPVLYQNPMVSMSMLRVLWRKAAEEGGLSVIIIDELTQLQAQQSVTVKTLDEQFRSMDRLLYGLCEAVRKTRLQTAGCSDMTKAVLEYLDLHLSENIRIDDLTAVTGYSRSQLSSIFKSDTGSTITGYIAQKRCEMAAELLTSTSLSIQDISLRVGYPDNNYFVKVFKKQLGVTPSDYRRRV